MRKLLLAMMIVGLLSLALVSTTFATHTPAPEFDHPGKTEQCENTDPSTKPAPETIPPGDRLQEMWESDCGEDAP